MLRRALTALGAACVAGVCAAPVAMAAGTPLTVLPQATNGHKVSLVATGLTTPTTFAFGGGSVFEGDGGNLPKSPGGIYVLKSHRATLVPGSPAFVAGLAWHKNTLYISGGVLTAKGPQFVILAWSGWTGTKFTQHKVFYQAPKTLSGFDGLAFGPDGRLYVGVGLAQTNDHSKPTTPFEYDVLAFNLKTAKPTIFARGIRQPWQTAFAGKDPNPFITDLGQDSGAKNPPDFLLHVTSGDNFGFPSCNWTSKKACQAFATPFKLFAPHTDVGGIAIVGKTIYLTEFGMGSVPPQIVSVPVKGGKVKVVVKGIPGPVIGIGAHNGWLYFGALNGTVYRVHT